MTETTTRTVQMKLRRITAGVYETPDGSWTIERQDPSYGSDYGTTWVAYHEDGSMAEDAWATLAEARADIAHLIEGGTE